MAILANELRIGNWVSQKYAEYDLANNSKGYYFSNNQIRFEDLKWCEDYPDNYNPIPLTPEILEKCGLKRTGRYAIGVGGYNTYGIGRVELLQPKKGDPFTLGFYETEVKYLHQLQNLYFALTGAELEVKL